jgi:hypothetical protein
MSSAKAYGRLVHEQLLLYATWLPDVRVHVGDVGRLNGHVFEPVRRLKDLGIPFNVVRDPKADVSYTFMSAGTKEMSVAASGTAGSGPAGSGAASLRIEFAKEDSVYFMAHGCSGSAIDDLEKLGDQILKQVEKKTWLLDYVVATRVVRAKSATIVQSSATGASIELEGNASGTPVPDLLKAGAAVKVKSRSSVGFSAVAKRDLTPLLVLGRVDLTLGQKLKRRVGMSVPTQIPRTCRKGVRDLETVIEPMEDVVQKSSGGQGEMVVRVRLPRYGDMVDMGGLFDLSARSIGAVRGRAPGAKGRALRLGTVLESRHGLYRTRVGAERLGAVVDAHPEITLDEDAADEGFVTVNMALAKDAGDTVDAEPLLALTLETAEPRQRATVSAELSFGEIA